jgi:FkbM family methyltransferase
MANPFSTAKDVVGASLATLLRPLTALDPARLALRRMTARRALPYPVYRHLSATASFTVALPAGSSFVYSGPAHDAIGNILYWRGIRGYEWETMTIFLELCRQAKGVVDVGSNTGLFSLVACAANPNVRVLAFEPLHAVHSILSRNIAANGWQDRCRAVEAAASDRCGSSELFVPVDDSLQTGAAIAARPWPDTQYTRQETRVTTLDDACSDLPRVDLIKVDVEGAEDKVLAGMPGILANDRPALILECNPGGPARQIEEALAPHGYRYYHLTQAGPVAQPSIIPDITERYRNYLCLCPRSPSAENLTSPAQDRPSAAPCASPSKPRARA